MPKLPIDATALSIALLGSAFGFSLLGGPFAWLAAIGGLVLALVLLAFDREGYRSVFESLAYAGAVSLPLTLAFAPVLRMIAVYEGKPPAFEGDITSIWMPLAWAGLTVLFWALDRMRMSGRVASSTAVIATGASPALFAPQSAVMNSARQAALPVREPPPAPAAPPSPVPSPAPAPAPSPGAEPMRATFTRPSFGNEPPVAATPPVTAAPDTPVNAAPLAAPTPPPSAPLAAEAPAPAAPQALPITPGKEATIYVSLVGEGMNVLRAVRAENLGRDYYMIADVMPEGESWQFGPGQVVRCKKRTLSSGKAMVAVEEAPRAQ